MSRKFNLELSDGLKELKQQFDQYTHEARVLDPADAMVLQDVCEVLFRRARKLENELSAHRCNEAARRDQDRLGEESAAIAAELARPDTNLALFPVIPRPFTDGHPRQPGGAA